MMRSSTVVTASVALTVLGMMLIIGGVIVPGVFLAGAVLIGISMVGYAAAGILQVREAR